MTVNTSGGSGSEDLGTSSSGSGGDSNCNTSQEDEAILAATSFMASRPPAQSVSGEGKAREDQKRRNGSKSFTPGVDDEDEESGESTPSGSSRSRSSSVSSLSETDESRQLVPTSFPTAETLSHVVINIVSLIVCVLVFGVFLVGSYDYFKNVEENKCEMTWMYQHPLYLPLPVGAGLDEKYPMYHLYAYVEGEQRLEAMSRENYRFTGIPVLYIPGNAGSYQQVRSLASVALWKFIDAGTPFHFDFFTVDLNEEFSALYGYTLQRQVEYTRQALVKIVNLYEEFHRVVLVGHSMGGVIAKAVALDEHGDNGASLSNLILTLATPHANPVIILDPEQDLFYYAVKKNWTRQSEESEATSPGGITLVSVSGGDRDYLVQPKLTRWPFTDVHVQTTGVPGVWASTDHLCIVWCKQLVLTVIRALYDLVEFHQRNNYYLITDNNESRRSVLNYHFVERTSGKSYYTSPKKSSLITLPKTIDQTEASTGLYCLAGGRRSSYVLFPTSILEKNVTQVEDARVIVLTTNTKDRNWIMGCLEFREGICYQAENLAYLGKIIPHIRRRRKIATLPLSNILSKYSHLMVKMDPYQVKTCVMLEAYEESKRKLPLHGNLNGSSNKIFYNFTVNRSPHSTSTLGGLIFNLMAWKIEVKPTANHTCPESHNILATFSHGNFEQSRFLKNESLIVRFSDWNTTSAWVAIYLEPTCSYTMSTSLSPLETAGQVFRLLLRFLPSFYASIILMTLYYQKDPLNWSSFHVLLLSNTYNLSIFPGFIVAVALHILPTDWPIMIDAAEYSVVLPIFLYMTAYCLVLCVSTGTWYAIITGGTAIHSVIVRVLSTRFGSWVPRLFSNHRGFSSVTEHVTEAAFEMTLTRFPLTIAVLLLALSFATSGSLGISLCVVLYLVKLFKLYEDLLEDLLKAKIANVKDSLSPMNFHFSCFMLWLVIGVLNLASLLHWTRSTGFSSSPQTQWDLSMYLCLLLLPTVAVLWQDFVPNIESNLWNVHRYVFFVMGLACVLWGTHRLYVTAFLIVFVFLTLATCQLLSVMMSSLLRDQPHPPSTISSSSPSAATDNSPDAPVPSNTPPAEASSSEVCPSSSKPKSSKDDLENEEECNTKE